MMLLWLMATAALRLPFSRRGSSSRPTKNMNKISPTWLMTFRYSRLLGMKSWADIPGATQPNRDGPRMIPATISPTTWG